MSELGLLTVAQVADELGVIPRRVRAMILAGRLPAQKVGRDWLVKEGDVDKVRGRKAGRPRVDK